MTPSTADVLPVQAVSCPPPPESRGPWKPPLRWTAGADAVSVLERKAKTLLEQAEAHRELSSSLAHDDI